MAQTLGQKQAQAELRALCGALAGPGLGEGGGTWDRHWVARSGNPVLAGASKEPGGRGGGGTVTTFLKDLSAQADTDAL